MLKLTRVFLLVVLGACGSVLAQDKPAATISAGERENVKELFSKISETIALLGLEVEVVVSGGKTSWSVRPANLSCNGKNTRKQIASRLSQVAAHVTALLFILYLMDKPSGVWDLIFKSLLACLGTGCLGGIINWMYDPIVSFLVDLFYAAFGDDEEGDNKKVELWLNNFLQNWPHNRRLVPVFLCDFFEKLYERYRGNGDVLSLSAHESQEVAISILSALVLDQHITSLNTAVQHPAAA